VNSSRRHHQPRLAHFQLIVVGCDLLFGIVRAQTSDVGEGRKAFVSRGYRVEKRKQTERRRKREAKEIAFVGLSWGEIKSNRLRADSTTLFMGSLSPNQPTGHWWGVPRGTSASAVLLLIVFGTEGTATYRNARTPPTPRYVP
jgi:hypothetical protein